MLSILIWRREYGARALLFIRRRSRPCNRCLLIVKRAARKASAHTRTHDAKGRSKGKGRPCGISSTTNINCALGGQKTVRCQASATSFITVGLRTHTSPHLCSRPTQTFLELPFLPLLRKLVVRPFLQEIGTYSSSRISHIDCLSKRLYNIVSTLNYKTML